MAFALVDTDDHAPVAVDWPEEMYTTPESLWSLVIGPSFYPISELDPELGTPSLDGPLRFRILAEEESAELELELFQDADGPNYRFVVQVGANVSVRRGERAAAEDIAEFFYENPPMIWFHDGSALEGNDFIPLKTTHPPYDASRILDWDWQGIDIRKESQGEDKAIDSIQARVIRTLMASDYHMIIDDDGKGEAADVVTIKLIGEATAPSSIEVEFYHCKYSLGAAAGHRIDDLYEVRGQAQKSIAWMSSHEKRTDLFTHLLRREARRQEGERVSRYEKGDGELLLTVRELSRLCPVTLRICIVQPGLSKTLVSPEQLELLGVTETYLMESYRLPFTVIASD